jgi:hypothetical protein
VYWGQNVLHCTQVGTSVFWRSARVLDRNALLFGDVVEEISVVLGSKTLKEALVGG